MQGLEEYPLVFGACPSDGRWTPWLSGKGTEQQHEPGTLFCVVWPGCFVAVAGWTLQMRRKLHTGAICAGLVVCRFCLCVGESLPQALLNSGVSAVYLTLWQCRNMFFIVPRRDGQMMADPFGQNKGAFRYRAIQR